MSICCCAVVVTGSSDGIGKAIAFQLASLGQNIVLIARNEKKLQVVAQEIVAKHNVAVQYLKIDFSDDEAIYEEIAEFLQVKDIGVLVNNVARGMPLLDFLDIPDLSEYIRSTCRINMISLLKMHQIVLPGMVERRRGLIMNIGSCSSLKPIYPVYGASKSFVDYYSQAISYEYEDKGITIQTCLPGWVNTKMIAEVSKTTSKSAIGPDAYAKSLLATVGKQRRTNGSFSHLCLAWSLSNFPLSIFMWMWKCSPDVRGDRKKDN